MNDLRLALRQCAKSPGFTVVAIITLALGIGVNTAVFSVIKAQVFTAFPYPEPERVVQLWRTNGVGRELLPWSVPDFFDVQEQATSFADMGAFRPENFTLAGTAPAAVTGIACTSGALRALGVQPVLGRSFSAEDEKLGSASTVLLSHGCWTQRFGADPGVVGQPIRLDGQSYTVIGVMPADFEFYCPWTDNQSISLWIPLRFPRQGQYRGAHWLLAVGRLKPGVSLETAASELKVVSQRLEAAHPDTNDQKWFYPLPLKAELATKAMARYKLVVAAVLLVLAVASANLAIMFLARGSGRQVEYAVRLALGASRRDLMRLALAESLVLALLGGVAGLFLTWNATDLLSALFVPFSTHGHTIEIDRAVLGCSLVLALIASLASGLPPALTASRTEVVSTMKEGGHTQAGSRIRHRFLRHLVTLQVAIALVLANTALLMLANHRAALATNEPLSSEYVLSSSISLKGMPYRTAPQCAAFWERFLERVRTLPGVTVAAVTSKLPLRGMNTTSVLADHEQYDPKARRAVVQISWASPEYFAGMGIGFRAGRPFEPADASARAPGIIINRRLAETYWPGQDAVGKTLRNNGPSVDYVATVVGVVEDVRQWDIGYPAVGEMYLPFAMNAQPPAHLVVRCAYDARRIMPLLRRELAQIDPDLALAEPMTMAEFVGQAARGRRTLLLLTNFFMASILVMTAVGLYGTLAFHTRQRTREIGVRLALGADRRDIVVLVLRQTVPWLMGGAAAGLAGSIGVAFALRSSFFDVNLMNPLYYAGGFVALAGVLAAACWLPARRATRVNPIEALRAE